MKSIQERINKGRDFAYGISQPVDIEQAYEMWDGFENFLGPEDLDTFNIINDVLFGDSSEEMDVSIKSYSSFLEEYGGSLFSYTGASPRTHTEFAHTKKNASESASRTKGDVEELFGNVLKIAKERDKISVLYTALKRCERSITEVKEITEENRSFGNNVGYYINTIFGSLSYFMDYLEAHKDTMIHKPKKLSKASIYMVIGGRNKMSEWNLLALIELGAKKAKQRFAREIFVEDFALGCEEFKKLVVRRA